MRSPPSTPASTSSISTGFLLCCLLWSSLPVNLSVSAKPADSEDSMRAEMGHMGDGSTNGGITASVSDHDEREEGQPTKAPYNCSLSHRPHSNDSNKFQVLHNKVWWDQVCQIGLVWNQTLCRCEYEKETVPEVPPSQCVDYRGHRQLSGKYQQKVNGVWLTRDCSLVVAGLIWNQTSCRCSWAPEGEVDPSDFDPGNTPCDTMLNVTFERGLVDEAKSSFLELTSGAILALRHYKSHGGNINTAAYFQNAVMTVWYFAGNEMSGSLRVEFRFKAEDSPQTRTRYQILLSNGCNMTGLGYTPPTLAIGYRADDRSFLLVLRTANIRKAIVCTRDLDPFAWHHVSLIYEDGTLLFRVNSYPCIISSDFNGEVMKTSCPLTIGADPLGKESRYMGFMDDLLVARHCRRFVEQAPVLSEDGGEEKEEAAVNDDEKNDDDGDNSDNRIPTPQSSSKAKKISAPAKDRSVARRGDKSWRRGDKQDEARDKSDRRFVKSGPRNDKSSPRADKSELRGVQSDRRGNKFAPRREPDQNGAKPDLYNAAPTPRWDKSVPRSQSDQREAKSGQFNDGSAQRRPKPFPYDGRSDARGDKHSGWDGKPQGNVDSSARRYSDKSTRRGDKPQHDGKIQRDDKSMEDKSTVDISTDDKSMQRDDNAGQRVDKPARYQDDKSAKDDDDNKPVRSRDAKSAQHRGKVTGRTAKASRPVRGKAVRRDRESDREGDNTTGRSDKSVAPKARKSKSGSSSSSSSRSSSSSSSSSRSRDNRIQSFRAMHALV